VGGSLQGHIILFTVYLFGSRIVPRPDRPLLRPARSDIAAGIQYAADRGARIINVSIGGEAPSATLQSAMDYASARGALVFAAAMNGASPTPN